MQNRTFKRSNLKDKSDAFRKKQAKRKAKIKKIKKMRIEGAKDFFGIKGANPSIQYIASRCAAVLGLEYYDKGDYHAYTYIRKLSPAIKRYQRNE